MNNAQTARHRAFITIDVDGVEKCVEVTLDIDLAYLTRSLGIRANRSKRRKATTYHGMVRASVRDLDI